MADPVMGAQVTTNLIPETTYGVLGAEAYALPRVTHNVKPKQELVTDPTLTGGLMRTKPTLGKKDPGGSLNTIINHSTIGMLLKRLMGTCTTTGTGPYEHTFSISKDVHSFGLEDDFTNALTTHRFMRMLGCIISGAQFDLKNDGNHTAAFNVIAQDWAKEATAVDGTPTALGHMGFDGSDLSGTIEIDGTVVDLCLRSLQLGVNNNNTTDAFCLFSGGKRTGAGKSIVDFTVQYTADLDSNTAIRTVLDGEEHKLTATLSRGTGDGSAGNESLTFNWMRFVNSVDAPGVQGPNGLLVTASGQGYQSATGAADFTIVLKNSIATVA